jgi:probable selenium-dependent hydroxylase accessory protein YqeC
MENRLPNQYNQSIPSRQWRPHDGDPSGGGVALLFSEALDIKKGVTAIIGSGGKTTLLHTLADELCGRVLLCTTTRMFPSDTYKTIPDPTLETLQNDWGRVLCVGTPAEHGKLGPCSLPMAELLRAADYVLVEADGSKGLPLKAHAPWEPVIPEEASQTVCVVGASGFGKPIPEAVHRPELWTEPDTSPGAVARMLAQEGGFSKVYINQCQSPAAFAQARDLAQGLDCAVFAGSLWKREIICLS